MMARRCWIVLLVLLVSVAQLAQAASVHAFLDRNQVSLGDTVTLNIQSSGSLGDPDLAPLQNDFEVLGSSRSSSVQVVNGKATRTSQLGIALRPLHAGTLTIPSLDVGGATTQALTLRVGAAPAGGSGKAGDPVFMETNVKSSSPWVGQQTVYTVRLFYLPGVNGALGDPSADGARLIPLDRDHRYVTERDGYTYKVIERSWALIPQRSGAVTVQGPVFEGHRLGPGFPNQWFNNPKALLNNPNALLNSPLHGFGGSIRATAPATRIDARAKPSNAGKPWLPARDVQLKLTGLPTDGKVDANSPLTVTLSVSASGQPAAALPDPALPEIADARVYPDQSQDATDDSGQWLRGTRTRSFAIVPDRNGTLTIPAITLNWWNVARDRAEQARLPAHTLTVSGVSMSSSAPATPPSSASNASRGGVDAAATSRPSANSDDATAANMHWRYLALASFALWIIAVIVAAAWWFTRLRRTRKLATRNQDGSVPPDAPAAHATAQPDSTREQPRLLRKRTLDAARDGDAAGCEHALLAWARATRPSITHAGSLRDALFDPAQRDALDALQRVRWQGGDATSACAAVAKAFADGFVWRGDGKPVRDGDAALPPLYPS